MSLAVPNDVPQRIDKSEGNYQLMYLGLATVFAYIE